MIVRIDRKALVTRHNPVIRGIEPLAPLSVGNGSFAFTADITGLQSFPEAYEIPLGTHSHWGWHHNGGSGKYSLKDVVFDRYDVSGKSVAYPAHPHDKREAYHWLRQYPHRLHLGRIGLQLTMSDGKSAEASDLQEPEQTLDLWRGLLLSRFRVGGEPVQVETVCHPESDVLGLRIVSPLIAEGRLELRIAFPSGRATSEVWAQSIQPDWEDADSHETFMTTEEQSAVFSRKLGEDAYSVRCRWAAGTSVTAKRNGKHQYALVPNGGRETLELTVQFVPSKSEWIDVRFDEVRQASDAHWRRFWEEGAAVELADSRDPRALELERRMVLSQFLTALHSAGPLPPQETGLLYNSWFGKAHLEMHWWHAAHFPLWGRSGLLERSMGWYVRILPKAKDLARSQGYDGARWPKMVGPEGEQSPSKIGVFLIWQQPHPIALAELLYQARPERDTLERYFQIVMDSAEFMASFARWDEEGRRYVLAAPLIPAQENHKPETTLNPVFELEYWRYGLQIALEWRERLGLPPVELWKKVHRQLAALPVSEDGLYLAHERCPDTFTQYHRDHPSMLAALGVLPGTGVDRKVMRNTLHKIARDWRWDTSWGWDFPMAAMTAARLEEPELAVDFLLMEKTKNTYLPNGHNYQRPGLYAYLPGNGGLLTAIALMAGGWRGAENRHAPGFPNDGSWSVRVEGLQILM